MDRGAQVPGSTTFDGGVFRSTDGGQSWAPMNAGLATLSVEALVISPSGDSLHVAVPPGPLMSAVFDFIIQSPPPPPDLVAAVLPSSRSVLVGSPATAFATIINPNSREAIGCGIVPITAVPAQFSYQTTDPATNALTGTPDTPVSIGGGQAQSFVVALTPTTTFGSFGTLDVQLGFSCANAELAPIISGVNTLLLTIGSDAVPDIVALSATLNNDGIVEIPGETGTGVFSVATVNLGVETLGTVSAEAGDPHLPVDLSVRQTDPATSVCVSAIGASVRIRVGNGDTPTFGVFVRGTATVPFDPAANRVFVRFRDAVFAVTLGLTSVAVRTR